MFDSAFFDSTLFLYVILPFLIFATRIVDVTMDTLRIVFISRGNKIIAPILGFFEILVWLMAITQIMQHLDNFACYVAYAAGFATGNYFGLLLEEKLAMGYQLVRVVTSKDSSPLIENLRQKGYGVTSIWAEGKNGQVHIIYSITQRSNVKDVIEIINLFNPKAFYSIEDVRSLNSKHNLFSPDFKQNYRHRWLRRGRQAV
jgi:uncharacterized protein YebE (UPF0316 family)